MRETKIGEQTANDPPLRILVEPSDIILRNVGDSAMLVVALRRLRCEFPNARIDVLTQDVETLRFYAPDVEPLSAHGRNTWAADLLLFNHLRRLPRPVITAVRGTAHALRRKAPAAVRLLLRAKTRARGRFGDELSQYLAAIDEADLVVVAGGGGLTDAFAGYALAFLETLELAIERGKPVALMGQGIGPMKGQQLRRRAQSVLRRADLIALREERAGRPLLRELGVSEERVMTTGDDAIELAYERRPRELGSGLGINVRVAGYAGVDPAHAQSITSVVTAAARERSAPIVAIPISSYDVDSDFATLRRMFPSANLPAASRYDVWSAIDLAAQCRVVVAGSYHAAVFALSAGVPVVCIASSSYYVDKFQGLADQFRAGCRVEFLDAPDFTERLARSIAVAWSEAEDVRPRLLEAAARQVEAGRAAYHRLRQITDAGCRMPDAEQPTNRLVRTMRRMRNPTVLSRDLRLLWATVRLRLFARSHVSRWSDPAELDPQWDERARLVAQHVPPRSRVLDFGAGRRSLERFLDPSCVYLPADLVSRGPDTVVFDLNARPLPDLSHLRADIAVFAGVLEYVRDVPSAIEWLSRQVPACIVSYQLANSRPGTAGRLRESAERAVTGWVNAYDREELLNLFETNGFQCELETVAETSLGGEPILLFRRV